jgi:hypothetical protein
MFCAVQYGVLAPDTTADQIALSCPLLLLQNPCPEGAAPGASGACVCGSTFTPAFNRSTLIACINGTSIASCPDSAPVEVRTLANTPVVVQCITQNTDCPTGFTLALYNGVPADGAISQAGVPPQPRGLQLQRLRPA